MIVLFRRRGEQPDVYTILVSHCQVCIDQWVPGHCDRTLNCLEALQKLYNNEAGFCKSVLLYIHISFSL